jgi:hypothetical protein
MQTIRPIEDAVTIRLADGQELTLLLSAGGLIRLKKRFGAKTMKDLLDRDAVDSIPILYEAIVDRGDLTEEQFADLLPADLEGIGRTVLTLMGVSLPARPTLEAPAADAPATSIQ